MAAPTDELPAAVRDCLQYVLPPFTPPMTRSQVEGYLSTNQRLINMMLHMQRERSQPSEVLRLQQHLTANLRLLAYYADRQMRTDVDHAQYADIMRNRPADPFAERDVAEAMMTAASRQASAAGAWAGSSTDAAAPATATAGAVAAAVPAPSERERLAEAMMARMPPRPLVPARPGPQSERIPPTAAERAAEAAAAAAAAAAASQSTDSASAPSTSTSAPLVVGARAVR